MAKKWLQSLEVELDADGNPIISLAGAATALTRMVPVAISAPGTPKKLVATETFVTQLILQAGRATAANTGLVSIGGDIPYTTDLQIQLSPGDTCIIEDPRGRKFDLAGIYLDGANTGDGVRGQYMPA